MTSAPIGIFDSGYGGLTVLKEIKALLPEYDYLYLGDNGRTPYGTRSFETVYSYTRECVKWLLDKGCNLVIVACNTASAKALRSIQQNDLPGWAPGKKILGVIRPTAEILGKKSRKGHIGILATPGTVSSGSYLIEIEKFSPGVQVTQQACPLWVPLIENGEYDEPGADYFVEKYCHELMEQDPGIDTVLLACTHYPLLENKIKNYLPRGVQVVSQGNLVAISLQDYLQRHPELETFCSKNGNLEIYTTDDPVNFDRQALNFLGYAINSRYVTV
ncbi:MAG: glutamate racemase [Ferruginibacter sp.]